MPEPGFTTYGRGLLHVLVIHDWCCDHSTWHHMLRYLTPDRSTYVFGDLRGYGAFREIEGTHTLDETSADAIDIANKLGWLDSFRSATR